MEKKQAKPNKTLERTSGLGASLLTALSVITLGLDWISRGQTMMDLYPYVHSPLLQLGVIVAAVITIIRATKLEQIREDDEAPRIITDGILTAGARELRKPKRHRRWIKLSCASALVSIIGISLLAWSHHHHLPGSKTVIAAQPSTPIPTQATPSQTPSAKPTAPTPTPPPAKPGVAQVNTTPLPVATPPPSQLNQNLPSPQPNAPPSVDAPATCPKDGTLTMNWTITNGNSSGMMGSYNFSYAFYPIVVGSLHPYLRPFVSPTPKQLNEDQLIKAINLIKEIRKLLPKPAPTRINQLLMTPEVTLQFVQRFLSAESADFIVANYVEKLPNGVNLNSSNNNGSESYHVPIASFSEEGKRTISDFDQLAKSAGDRSCKDGLNQLTKRQ